MKQQILEILNKGGVHIPTISDFREIAKHTYEGKASDFTAEWFAIQISVLMQRFEELTRGKWEYPMVSNDSKNAVRAAHVIENGKVWQPAILKREMFEGENAWFEYRTLNERPTAIDLALSYGEIWKFIKSQDNGSDKWKFTESFVNQLIKP